MFAVSKRSYKLAFLQMICPLKALSMRLASSAASIGRFVGIVIVDFAWDRRLEVVPASIIPVLSGLDAAQVEVRCREVTVQQRTLFMIGQSG